MAEPVTELCTYHKSYAPNCGRPESDKAVHVAEHERMRRGAHVYRHDPKDANRDTANFYPRRDTDD